MLLHFRIQLANITKPPVWRQLTVPADFSVAKFHLVIQAAFGWNNVHLYFFSPGGFPSSPWIKIPDEEDKHSDVRVMDAGKTKLKDIFPANQQYTYIYDFGDDWKHNIRLERISEGKAPKAVLTGGKGACPPEDCGGPWGYEGLKETLKDPGHPEYADMRDWLGLDEGETWDATRFALEAAQDAVSSIA